MKKGKAEKFTLPGVKMFGRAVSFVREKYKIRDNREQCWSYDQDLYQSMDKSLEKICKQNKLENITIEDFKEQFPDHYYALHKTYKIKPLVYWTTNLSPLLLFYANAKYAMNTGIPGGIFNDNFKNLSIVATSILALMLLEWAYQFSVAPLLNKNLRKKILKSAIENSNQM